MNRHSKEVLLAFIAADAEQGFPITSALLNVFGIPVRGVKVVDSQPRRIVTAKRV